MSADPHGDTVAQATSDSARADQVANLLEYLHNVAEYKPTKTKRSQMEELGFFIGCCFPWCIGWLLMALMWVNSFVPGAILTLAAMALSSAWWSHKQRIDTDGERSPTYAEFKQVRARLTGHVNVQQVPDLIDLCGMSYGCDVVPVAAVAAALPLVGPEHKAAFNTTDRAGLCGLTSWRYPTELRLSAVRALEHIGTGDAVDTLSKILSDRRAPQELKEEVKRILPVLAERRNSDDGHTLLRPAENADHNQLLRSADHEASDSSNLLRPTANEEIPTDQQNQQAP